MKYRIKMDGRAEYQLRTFDRYFQEHDGKYRIFVSTPSCPASGSGYPVIYLLDGNLTFPMMQASQKERCFCPVVTVGIGYPYDSGSTSTGVILILHRQLR